MGLMVAPSYPAQFTFEGFALKTLLEAPIKAALLPPCLTRDFNARYHEFTAQTDGIHDRRKRIRDNAQPDTAKEFLANYR